MDALRTMKARVIMASCLMVATAFVLLSTVREHPAHASTATSTLEALQAAAAASGVELSVYQHELATRGYPVDLVLTAEEFATMQV